MRFTGLQCQVLINGIIVNWEFAEKPVDDNPTYQHLAGAHVKDLWNQLALHYRMSSLSSGTPMGRLHPGDRMPNLRLADGANLFDQMRGIHATEVETQEGVRILVRPDGYISSIGKQPTENYAGEFTRRVQWLADGLGESSQ